ncbi:molybdate-binding protein [Clostridium bornimense]|uniref:Molybdate-binding protein n=1 Tax=Clostridium bornimense TaxID=1216932 RepID=W6S0G3_9CLOT|nr:helix-turn-helix transcriptional regulator [Clostridium bornimense]CDM70243.1 molybdate-binding protein [Clostridium bornimense]
MDKNKKFLSPLEVAEILSISKKTVYEIIKRNELKAYKVGNKLRISPDEVKRYIGEDKEEFADLREEIKVDYGMYSFSELYKNHIEDKLVICGKDSIIDILVSYLSQCYKGIKILRLYDNSFNGLCALYNGDVKVTASHIWNADTDRCNVDYVRSMLPGISTTIINLCYRTQGFYVQKGNPKNIKSWKDLSRKDVILVNRELGSGTRILIDESLKKFGIEKKDVQGYGNNVTNNREVVNFIRNGKADVGVGVKKHIRDNENLEFIPIHKESYDLVIKTEDLHTYPCKAIIDILKLEEFKSDCEENDNYDYTDMGKIIAII